MPLTINHCIHCGEKVSLAIPRGDNRNRHVCNSCGHIHYQNPKVVCGCIPVWGERILLCRRAIEPRKGFWTLPAGFMENGETLEHAAVRETMEEACAKIVAPQLFGVYSLPQVNQVYVMFLAQLGGESDFAAGEESLEVGLFAAADIPWADLAFPVVHRTLQRYLEMRPNNLVGHSSGNSASELSMAAVAVEVIE